MVRFSNGNVLFKVPDASVKEEIRVWSDTDHLFDVVFADARRDVLMLIEKANGSSIRILKTMPEETAFVLQSDRESKTCNLTVLDKTGKTVNQVSYRYFAYPDAVSAKKVAGGYELVHDNIEDKETFLLDQNGGAIRSLSYEKHGETR